MEGTLIDAPAPGPVHHWRDGIGLLYRFVHAIGLGFEKLVGQLVLISMQPSLVHTAAVVANERRRGPDVQMMANFAAAAGVDRCQHLDGLVARGALVGNEVSGREAVALADLLKARNIGHVAELYP